jgi:hypothetical protein
MSKFYVAKILTLSILALSISAQASFNHGEMDGMQDIFSSAIVFSPTLILTVGTQASLGGTSAEKQKRALILQASNDAAAYKAELIATGSATPSALLNTIFSNTRDYTLVNGNQPQTQMTDLDIANAIIQNAQINNFIN